MRVVHLNTERGWRGGERQTLWLAAALAARGHASVVAARPGEPLWLRAREAGLETVPLAPRLELDPLAAHRLNRFLLSFKADVLHAHAAHAVGLAAFASLGAPAARVATRRVDFPLKGHALSRLKYARMDAVACISRRVREMVLAAGVPEAKTVLIPSGVDAAGYPSAAADRARLRRERGFKDDDVVIVTVGALVPHKGHAVLLAAAREVVRARPGALFLIIGDGPLRGELEARRDALGLRTAVRFMDRRPDPLAWTALADVFAFPSIEEGLGTALIDALAVGVPTAASAAGGIPDIYGGADAPELTPPGDAAALARNILAVLGDPAEAARRVERGRARAALFTVDAMAERYVRLYEKIRAS